MGEGWMAGGGKRKQWILYQSTHLLTTGKEKCASAINKVIIISSLLFSEIRNMELEHVMWVCLLLRKVFRKGFNVVRLQSNTTKTAGDSLSTSPVKLEYNLSLIVLYDKSVHGCFDLRTDLFPSFSILKPITVLYCQLKTSPRNTLHQWRLD